MIRFLLRTSGLFCLATAFILVIYDGTKSIAANRLFLTSISDLWTMLNAASLAKVRPLLEPYAGGILWDPVASSFLAAPAWGVFCLFGVLLILMGRRRKPLIGYAR
jgi:hypothetical protein